MIRFSFLWTKWIIDEALGRPLWTNPRHLCKFCRHYWTKCGSLHNVPVGGGMRKASSSSIVPKTPSSPKTPSAVVSLRPYTPRRLARMMPPTPTEIHRHRLQQRLPRKTVWRAPCRWRSSLASRMMFTTAGRSCHEWAQLAVSTLWSRRDPVAQTGDQVSPRSVMLYTEMFIMLLQHLCHNLPRH
jgi:hypothetical protein